jgi:hypothetical protein
MGLVVAIPRGGSPTVDLMVSTYNGDHVLAVQVKTARWAGRERGREEARAPDHLEFPLGAKAADVASDSLMYVFVDLLGEKTDSVPEAYIVPSAKVKAYCENWAKNVPMVRWHPKIAEAAAYKNNWSAILDLLTDGPRL